ncbi:MAG: hypothetical protein HZA89_06650 [Verrucomicrobia bacterium]|nr:hypothetical protein [Verrucomicrobiota bacterium]
MKAATTHRPMGGTSLDNLPNFNVLIVYEDFASGWRAKTICQNLVRECGGDCEFQQTMWKFDALKISRLKDIAAEEAAGADMIIISTQSDSPLAEEVKSWIELWAVEKVPQNRSLVSMSISDASPAGGTGSAHSYLERVAQRAHMDFFAKTVEPEDEDEFTASRLEPARRMGGSFQLGAANRHYGINKQPHVHVHA